MIAVFADTSYYGALLPANDDAHAAVVKLSETLDYQIVTTTAVLAELGNFFAKPAGRSSFVSLICDLEFHPDMTVVEYENELIDLASNYSPIGPTNLDRWSIMPRS